MKIKDTLNLGKTAFPMRAGLPNKEPKMQEAWDEAKLYENRLKENAGKPSFILHDGPPYANGDIHVGHALNKISKDMIMRYKNMAGFRAPYVPGWDTHGLPIEQVLTKKGIKRKELDRAAYLRMCQEYALTQVDLQRKGFKSLGVLGDWENPYITLKPEFEAAQIRVFGKMAEKDYIYKGAKPIYWSPSSESSLAEAEIEYQDVRSASIYIAFKAIDTKGLLPNDSEFVIWTTTPWTIPSNQGIFTHPDYDYVLVGVNDRKFVVASELLNTVAEKLAWENYEVLQTVKGSDLDGMVAKHPFYDRDALVMNADYVTLDSGTGLVHVAPGHGEDDYVYSRKYKLDVLSPIDDRGYYTDEAPGFEGLFYDEGNKKVSELLSESGALLKLDFFTHSYPHDWRTGKPLIFRATDQWFCSIEPIREDLIKAIHDVNWYPSWGEQRMVNMIKDRGDWCISRQRAWGVPIPIFYCEDGTPIIEKEVFDHIANLFREHGSNIWYEKEAKDLLPKGYKNAHSPNGEFTKEKDIMDVWFDSGSSWNGVLRERGTTFPSDLYLEGSDQYRGWFNSSLILSVATQGVAPYKTVVSHGWVLDEHGEQMHKSKGNGVDPNKIANMYGADILRLWVATVDYQQDVRIGDNLIKQVAEQYRKIRNTLKFISWNLPDFDPAKDMVNTFERVDLYILAKLEEVSNGVIIDMDNYDFASALSKIMTFMSTDLSAFYLNIAKDALYFDKKVSLRRKQFQSVFYILGETLLRLLNPIIPFTMDEFNKNMPGDRKENAQLLDYPKASKKYDPDLLKEYALFNNLKDAIYKVIEEAKINNILKSSQEAKVEIEIKNDNYQKLFDNIKEDLLASSLVISSLERKEGLDVEEVNGVKVKVSHSDGYFCERCHNYEDDALEIEEGLHLCKRCHHVIKG